MWVASELLPSVASDRTLECALARFSRAFPALSPYQIIYRNLTTDTIVLDETGYVQLTDFRYACKTDPIPTDFCSYPHYLSPEQVSGQGHGQKSDFWALGILVYELISGGANPWLTGDPAKDSEVGVYTRIAAHQEGSLTFPDGAPKPSEALGQLLEALLHPEAKARLGGRGVSDTSEELRQHEWFTGLDWDALEEGSAVAPHAELAAQALAAAIEVGDQAEADKFTGDSHLFDAFGMSSGDLSA